MGFMHLNMFLSIKTLIPGHTDNVTAILSLRPLKLTITKKSQRSQDDFIGL